MKLYRFKYLALLVITAQSSIALASNAEMEERAKAAAKAGTQRIQEYDTRKIKPAVWEDEERIKAIAEKGRQRGLEAYDALLKKEAEKAQAKDTSPKPKSSPVELAGRIVVALSSSMPEEELRAYFAELDGHQEPIVVFRGFIGGATFVKPTLKWLERITRKDPINDKAGHYMVETVVDPLIYRQLNIQQVPAVAWLEGVQKIAHCEQEDFQSAVVVHGVMPVKTALQIARKEANKVPKHIINGLKATGWEQRR